MANNRVLTSHCAAAVLGCAILASSHSAALANEGGKTAEAAVAPQADVIRTVAVTGAERLEPATIVGLTEMRPGQVFTEELADRASKQLMATGLFASLTLTNDGGNVVISVVEKTA